MNSRTGNTCLSTFGTQVKSGEYFTPIGRDICEQCQCLTGQAVGCFTQTCLLPECDKFKPVNGKCCVYECLQGDGLSTKVELAFGVGLFLILVILIAIFFYCRRQSRKKNAEQKPEKKKQPSKKSVPEQTQSTNPAADEHLSENINPASGNTRHVEQPRQAETIELPPPYSPPEHIDTVNKSSARQRLPPNEPPPPYDREASTV